MNTGSKRVDKPQEGICVGPGQLNQLVGVLSHAPKGCGSIPGQSTYRFILCLGHIWASTS